MLALHRRAPEGTAASLLALTVLGELSGTWLNSQLPLPEV
jgi:hypothetical protein